MSGTLGSHYERCKAVQPDGTTCGAFTDDEAPLCDWHINVRPDQLIAPEPHNYEFVCLHCASRTASPWNEEKTLAFNAAGKLRCANCRGAVLAERQDIGAIGSPQAVTRSAASWRTVPRHRVA